MSNTQPKFTKQRHGKFAERERLRAETLALQIEHYWATRGAHIRCRLVDEDRAYPEDPADPLNNHRGFGLRTNLINGLPPELPELGGAA